LFLVLKIIAVIQNSMSSQRFINLDPAFGPLIHDILKTTATVLLSGWVVTQFPGLGGQFSALVAQLIALVIFHTIIEAYVIGAGTPCCPLEKITGSFQYTPVDANSRKMEGFSKE
jgi:hypothetical protein